MLYWVRDGQPPDLGPLSSFGTAHHGVAYYWLLAPGAFLTDVDPVAACATTALIGVAGVAATWWLGREIGGPIAGYVAGLLAAVSPAAISASTFVWNSNVEGPAAALAVAAGWRAWRTRRARWWMVAMVGVVVLTQAHLAAALAAPPLVGLAVADVIRRTPQERRRMWGPMMGAIAIALIGYLPFLIHELHHDFSETHAILDYLVNGTSRALSACGPRSGRPTGDRLASPRIPGVGIRSIGTVGGFSSVVRGGDGGRDRCVRDCRGRATVRPVGARHRGVGNRRPRSGHTEPRHHHPRTAERPVSRLARSDPARIGWRSGRVSAEHLDGVWMGQRRNDLGCLRHLEPRSYPAAAGARRRMARSGDRIRPGPFDHRR